MELSKNLKKNYFKCEICEKSFHTNLKRNQHIKNAHGEVKNFTCNVCNRIFGRKHQLALHLKNYHQEAHEYYNLSKFHQNRIKNKGVYLIAHFCKQTADLIT